MCAAAGVGVGVLVGVAVMVAVFVGVGVAARRSGRTIVCTLTSGSDAVSTLASTVTDSPCRAESYFRHDSALPGCPDTVNERVQTGSAPLSDGLVTDTPPVSGGRMRNITGILFKASPCASLTCAVITLLRVPSRLSLASFTNSATCRNAGSGRGVGVNGGVGEGVVGFIVGIMTALATMIASVS